MKTKPSITLSALADDKAIQLWEKLGYEVEFVLHVPTSLLIDSSITQEQIDKFAADLKDISK